MSFLKEHLAGNHYHWLTAPVGTAFSGSPGRRLFDPFNGLQVLYIINYFGEAIGKLTIDQGRKLETLMLKELPTTIKSEMGVFNWLREQYMYEAD
ncbi:hypothetical protein D3H65_02975 [Paraflavitalea soli]|uniref:Uncharacterized protein n=1 Tax=Paraflavitalea soli TaxID=2315862 RepID=A0A3B7MI56_9BACT|nr:hypothetical protein [Paraflavitalea soli]AXY72993.1 hypothetical protein D3H65_02975 [Paraflavitalea soli]